MRHFCYFFGIANVTVLSLKPRKILDSEGQQCSHHCESHAINSPDTRQG